MSTEGIRKGIQEETLNFERVLFQGCRRSGKTTAAIKWAKNRGEKILYLARHTNEINNIIEKFVELYGDEITGTRDNSHLSFENGTEIHFMSYSRRENLRGRRVDCIVIDDFEFMSKETIEIALSCALDNPDFSFFIAHTRPMYFDDRMDMFENRTGVAKFSIDYLDLIQDGTMSIDGAREISSMLTAETFSREFGPYPKPVPIKESNRIYKHLLTKE